MSVQFICVCFAQDKQLTPTKKKLTYTDATEIAAAFLFMRGLRGSLGMAWLSDVLKTNEAALKLLQNWSAEPADALLETLFRLLLTLCPIPASYMDS